jgi:hypothetical protein
VGRYVRTRGEFLDALQKGSEEASAVMNRDVRYEPVDLREKDALGVTEAGLDETRRYRRKVGLDEPGATHIDMGRKPAPNGDTC